MVNKDVTFVTHCTVDQLYHLMEMSDRWDGPMSGIDFLKPQGRSLAVNILNILRTPDDSSSFLLPYSKIDKNAQFFWGIDEENHLSIRLLCTRRRPLQMDHLK